LQVTLDARADLRVHIAFGRANPFEVDGDVLLNDLGHEDLRGRGRGSGFGSSLALTSSQGKNCGNNEHRVKNRPDQLNILGV
jgi:hypothetical protein